MRQFWRRLSWRLAMGVQCLVLCRIKLLKGETRGSLACPPALNCAPMLRSRHMQNKQNLIWIDLEMTGLDPDNDVIIEMATIITDSELNTLAEGPVIPGHQSDDLLNGMDEWNPRQHGGSGLTQRVRESKVSTAQAEAMTLEFIK